MYCNQIDRNNSNIYEVISIMSSTTENKINTQLLKISDNI